MTSNLSSYSPQSEPGVHTKHTANFKKVLIVCGLFFVILTLALSLYVKNLAKPPANFPVAVNIEILPGTPITNITKQLKTAGVVKSDLLLYVVLLTYYEPKNVKASTYYFDEPLDVYGVAQALVAGDFDTNLVSFIHIEGERATHIAKNAETKLINFSAREFMQLASTSEGKLFPETYRIPKDFSEQQLFDLMLATYEEKVAPLRTTFTSNILSESDIIILASIIEREANSTESMKMVAGILQNRLSIGMGLQVDASMEYILDKPLKELTAADLKMESPYNTYLYRGLTPTAIGNPGLDAIKAVLEPTPSEYMFYITGDDGNFYYAKDFEGHKLNVSRHLK